MINEAIGQTGQRKFQCPSNCRTHQFDKAKNYNGEIDKTRKGIKCVPWQFPKAAQNMVLEKDKNGKIIGKKAGNHCRNTGRKGVPMRRRPWCYTNLKTMEWDFCDIPICNLPAPLRKCTMDAFGKTKSGINLNMLTLNLKV